MTKSPADTTASIPRKTIFQTASKWHNAALAFFAIAILLSCYCSTDADPDLWGHVRFGQDLLQNHKIIQTDAYSFASKDQEWINHEWLAEGIFAAVFNSLGARGLIILKLLISLGITALIYIHLYKNGMEPLPTWILILLVCNALRTGVATVRPHLFTYICFAALFFILSQAERKRPIWVWILVPLFALWPNLHGGFLAGVAILMLWVVCFLIQSPSWRRGDGPQKIQIPTVLPAAFASLAATFLNPYGLKLWSFLLETATIARPEISEWQPLSLISTSGVLYLSMLFLGLAALICSRKRPLLFEVLGYALCALLPMIALRHWPLFAVAFPFLAGRHIADLCNRLMHSGNAPLPQSHINASIRSVFTFVFAVGGLVFLTQAWAYAQQIRVDESNYPIKAVRILKDVQAKGAMAVDFDWGEYVIWHLGPAVQVSLDGRRETVYSPVRYQESLNFMYGINDWNAILRNEKVNMVLVKNRTAIFNLMAEQNGWILAYSDDVSGLFLKRASDLYEMISSSQLKPVGNSVFP